VAQTRIVIAEDQPVERMDLREMLENMGYVVAGEAGDGVSAVRLARELKPDIVIMDIRMPELDGISAARVLTEEQIAPVVLVTAFHDQEQVKAATDAGVFAYVSKPFGEPQLSPAIQLALSLFQQFRSIREEVRTVKEALETRKLVERAKGVLMDKQGLKEAEAYRRIQKLSMNTRKTMREVAEAILLANDLDGNL